MQVQFSPNELQVFADTLARHNSELIHEIARTDHREFRHILRKKLELLMGLQSQLLRGELQLSTEQRDALAEVLDQSENALYFEIARTDHRAFKQVLERNLDLLERVHGKITEPCAAA
jgi:arginine deiminase